MGWRLWCFPTSTASRCHAHLQLDSGLACDRGEAGVPNLHLQDLRHTGNTLATKSGANLRALMARMGHVRRQRR